MKNLIIAASIATVVGCANGLPNVVSSVPESIERQTHKVFLGIPVVASLDGSYAVLNNEWAVTAAHNSPILDVIGKEVYYHPRCDIALFKIDDGEQVSVGVVYANNEIHHAGYPVYLPMAFNSGKFLGDVVSTSRPNCVASMSDASIMTGMSGGGVYNSKHELVGINVGFSAKAVTPEGDVIVMPTLWQSLFGVRDWIEEITGVDFYGR